MKHSIILIVIAFTGLMLVSCDADRDGTAAGESDDARTASRPIVSAEAIETSLAAAEDYFHTRDLAKAEAILLRLLDRVPDQPHALELHGQLLMAKAADAREAGNPRRSAQHFNEAYERYYALVELQPHSAGLQQSAGEVAQVAGRQEDALTHYNAARQLNPTDPKPHFFAAQIYIERGEYAEAKDALQHVLNIDPDEPLAHASLANVAVQQGRYGDALTHIAEAREIRPGDVSFRVIEASIYRKQGDAHAALQLLVPLTPQERSRWFVAEELAAAYAAEDKHDRVAAVWMHVHEARPRDARAWLAAIHAGHAFLLDGQREKAWLLLREARLTEPDAPETRALADAFSQSE